MAPEKHPRGGAGRGQGRKPIQRGEDTVTVSLRLTTSQRAKLAALGGAAWVRQQIDAPAPLLASLAGPGRTGNADSGGCHPGCSSCSTSSNKKGNDNAA